MNKLMVVFLVAMTFGSAFAGNTHETGYARVGDRGDKVLLAEIHTMRAPTEEELVNKAAGWMKNFTQTSSFEACANICKSQTSNEFAAILSSSHSQISCGVSRDRCPEGFVPVDRTIHSHPHVELSNTIVLNEQDRSFLRARSSGRQIPQKMRFRADPRTFSKEDMEAGAGYLVTADRVLFQDGKNITVLQSN